MQLDATLNQSCQCVTLDRVRLQVELERDPAVQGLAGSLQQTHPHLFSNSMVFISTKSYEAIAESIACIERVMAMPEYVGHTLQDAPGIAQFSFGPSGVMMGYDFHINANVDAAGKTQNRPQLIEINTNAGGAMLSAALARSQILCCQPAAAGLDYNQQLARLHDVWFAMFQNEWRSQRGDQPLRHVAIVDDTPEAQYLAPEFALFRQMFEARGVRASIASPEALQWCDGVLWLEPQAPAQGQITPDSRQAIDLVYNRLTDFDLSSPAHLALREAYLAQAVVLTPHPHAHALRANKRNLVTLSDAALLFEWSVPQGDRQVLENTIPATRTVSKNDAESLWAKRRQLFFKPVAGYGGKAAFRGDKLTKGAWAQVLEGDFVAQTVVPPGVRVVNVEGVSTELKYDVRAYTYQGKIQLLTARTYQGQTTNFRTPGGGFSPVLVVPRVELPLDVATPTCAC